MREPAADDTPEQRRLLADVTENGVHIVHVDDGDDWPAYSYTVGLFHSFDQPEVIVFGMPEEVAEQLLNAVADEAAEGKHFVADSQHDGLLIGYPARFFAVTPQQRAALLPLLEWAAAGASVPVVQLVWPDKQGRWPWDPNVREGFAEGQPVLARRGDE